MIVGSRDGIYLGGGYYRRIRGRVGYAAVVVMAQRWGALMGEVRIRVCCGGDAIVEWVALAGDGMGAIAGNVGKEA